MIRRPEFWGPNLIVLFLKYKQCFHGNIINNDTSHKDYDTTARQSYSTYFNSIRIKYTPCQGVVWSQYRLPGTFYVPLGFGVVLSMIGKVCFFLPAQFCEAVDFYTDFIVPKL